MKFFVFFVVAMMLCTSVAMAAVYSEQYEMDSDVLTAGGALFGHAMGLNGADFSGMTYSGGTAIFTDNTSSGNYGVSLTGAAAQAVVGTGDYTVDMKIRWIAGCDGNASAKTMGFGGQNGSGRGIRINQGDIQYISAGYVTSGGCDFTNGQWQTLRIVVLADGSQTVYNMGDFHAIMSIVAPGATGLPGATGGNPVISLGNYAGGSTTLTSVEYDYVRLAQGALAPVPEPGSLLALGSGLIGMAGFAIRRRRA